LASLAYRTNAAAANHPVYQLDNELSGRDNKVWTLRHEGTAEGNFLNEVRSRVGHTLPKLVMGHRGTSRATDWPNNVVDTVALAPVTQRHKKAEQLFEKALSKHHVSLEHAAVVGHSAGGLVASHLSSRFGVQSHAFNPHIPLVATENYGNRTNHIYISGRDPVSAMARFFPTSRVTYVKAKRKDHHSLENFL
jgi:pimeloyl-ACP methyl ester carboxylesterase